MRREDYRLILCSQGTPFNVFTKRCSTDLVLLLECNFKVRLKMFRVRWLMIGTPDNDCVKQRSLNAIVHYPLHNDTPFNVLEVSLPDYKQLVQNLNNVKNCDVIIGTDHNLDFLKSGWHMDTQNFIELNLDSNLLPCITRPTRITKSTATLIDNVLISKNLQGKQDSKIIITDISDHLPSIVTISGNILEKKQKIEIISRKINDKTIQAIMDVLAGHDWESDFCNEDVNSNFTLFHDRLLSTLNKMAPECKIKLTNKQSKREPWIGPSLLKCCTKQHKYFKQALKSKDDFHWER